MSVTFQQQVQLDLAVMTSTKEFGRVVNIDGVDMVCVEIADDGAPYKAGQSQDIPGLDTGKRTLIFTDAVMPSPPVANQQLAIDGEYWYVQAVKRRLGHVILDIIRPES